MSRLAVSLFSIPMFFTLLRRSPEIFKYEGPIVPNRKGFEFKVFPSLPAHLTTRKGRNPYILPSAISKL